jgi:predicted nucleotidyltransferase
LEAVVNLTAIDLLPNCIYDATMTAQLPTLAIYLPLQMIAEFCRKWNIQRLEVFGSVLRQDFTSQSDVDLVATYNQGAHWSLLDRVHMKHELEDIVGREIDLLNRRALEKEPRTKRAEAILKEVKVLYAES